MKIKRTGSALALTALITCFVLMLQGCGTYYNMRVREYDKANEKARSGAVVFLGDSLTELCRLDDYYPVELEPYNRGISGDTTDGVIKRLSSNVISVAPTQIVLLIGINDLNRGRSADYVLQNIIAIIETITNELPSCRLIVQSLYPVYSTAIENYARNTWKITEINSQLESRSNEYGYVFVNAFLRLKNADNELDKKFSPDGLHLNSEGYAEVTPLILAELVKPLGG